MSVKTGVFPSNIPGKSVFTKASSLSEMPYQQQRGKCQLAESLSSEHEILVNKTPEAENDIRETGTNFNNETATSSEFAETNAYSTKKMPSTDDENNLSNSTDQFRLLDEKCADLENKVSDLEGKNRTPSSNSFSLNRFILLIRQCYICLLYTSPSPRDGLLSRMPSSA